MKAVVLCLLFYFVGVSRGDITADCDMAAYYLELGCTPSATGDVAGTKCPEYFTCPDLHPDPKKCFYKGMSYGENEMIPQNLVSNPCSQACICTTRGVTSFECAAVDCVQTFDRDLEQCIYTHDLDSCCYVGTVCGKDDVAKLMTCEVDGKTFKEGQQFYPKDTRKVCICSRQWNGTVDHMSYCTDINCGVEIHYQDKLMDKCAPIFLASDPRGCPLGFQCPSNSSKLVRGLNVQNVSSQCVFGNLTLSVGDEVTVEDQCVKCSCEVPPYVTCKQGPSKGKPTAGC